MKRQDYPLLLRQFVSYHKQNTQNCISHCCIARHSVHMANSFRFLRLSLSMASIASMLLCVCVAYKWLRCSPKSSPKGAPTGYRAIKIHWMRAWSGGRAHVASNYMILLYQECCDTNRTQFLYLLMFNGHRRIQVKWKAFLKPICVSFDPSENGLSLFVVLSTRPVVPNLNYKWAFFVHHRIHISTATRHTPHAHTHPLCTAGHTLWNASGR